MCQHTKSMQSRAAAILSLRHSGARLCGRVPDLQSGGCRFESQPGLLCTKVYSAFHASGVGKWVPAAAGKAKAGMAYSTCGWNAGCAGKTVIPWQCVLYQSTLEMLYISTTFTFFCAYILHILSDFFHHQVSPNGFTEFWQQHPHKIWGTKTLQFSTNVDAYLESWKDSPTHPTTVWLTLTKLGMVSRVGEGQVFWVNHAPQPRGRYYIDILSCAHTIWQTVSRFGNTTEHFAGDSY